MCKNNLLCMSKEKEMPPLMSNQPLPNGITQNSSLSTVFFEQNWCLGGNRGDFHVQMSVSPLAAITGPVFSRDWGSRHSLNNLAALCHRALGSQPSKVMTERHRLTSPSRSLPITTYLPFMIPRRQSKRPHWGGEIIGAG